MNVFEKLATLWGVSPHPKRLEHETKYVFPNHQIAPMLRFITHACRRDPEFPRNIIASIYYDTHGWKFLREKVDSDYLKTKVRVRWYRNPDTLEPEEHAFIEVKSKIGVPRAKFRLKSPFSGEWLSRVPLEDPRLLEIPRLLRSHGALPEHAPIFPAFIVQYERCRFIEPQSGVRVCIDWNIHAPKVNPTMLCAAPSSYAPMSVLEVKGRCEGLPGTLAQLFAFGMKKSSFSKYLACYHALQHIEFH